MSGKSRITLGLPRSQDYETRALTRYLRYKAALVPLPEAEFLQEVKRSLEICSEMLQTSTPPNKPPGETENE